MARSKKKPDFIGIRVSEEQRVLLTGLQEALQLPSKTEVLLTSLEHLAQHYSLPTDSLRQGLSTRLFSNQRQVQEPKLGRLEVDAWRYVGTLHKMKNSIEEVLKQVAQELSVKDKTPDQSRAERDSLIQTLVNTQREEQLLPRSVVASVSERFGVPISQIYRLLEAVGQAAKELTEADEVIEKFEGDKSALIQILLEVQRENHWLPANALIQISEKLGIPLSQVYQIATFYTAFSLTPQGRHHISVCMGTACHVRNAPRLLDKVTEAIKIGAGETSPDRRFTLDTVNCLGCCALGPVMVVDGEYHSNPSPKEISEILSKCE